jgi:hypothetical protein
MQMKILQIGRLGDIIIVIPIAKWFADRGYQVIWPVCSEYLPLLTKHVPYVQAIDLGAHQGDRFKILDLYKSALALPVNGNTLNLSCGFSDPNIDQDWLRSGLSFDRWKYQHAGIPIEEKYNISMDRNIEREHQLYQQIVTTDNYVVTHSQGTRGHVNFNIPNAIEVRPVEGYTLFDWITILQLSEKIFCVDSCVANLVNQFGINMEKRFFKSFGPPGNLIPALDIGWTYLE